MTYLKVQLKLMKYTESSLHHHLWGNPFLPFCEDRLHEGGVMCGGSSPYSTIDQVIPGCHVEETIQVELVKQQLENRFAQVWINSGWISNQPASWVKKKQHFFWVYLINRVLIYGDRLEPVHQNLHLWIRIFLWSQLTIYIVKWSEQLRLSVLKPDANYRHKIFHGINVACKTKTLYSVSSIGRLYNLNQ